MHVLYLTANWAKLSECCSCTGNVRNTSTPRLARGLLETDVPDCARRAYIGSVCKDGRFEVL